MDYKMTASEILKHIGGEKNVIHFEHCSTRLRFTLADSTKANIEAIKGIKGVMGVVMTAQCQIIIGNDVIEVYDEIMKIASFDGNEPTNKSNEKKKIGATLLDFLVGVFQPIVPAIAGAGILKAMLSLFVLIGIMDNTGTVYKTLFYAADAALYFLPLMVAVTTASKLKANRLVAMAAVGALILPNMTTMITEGAVLFGVTIKSIAYPYQVFPAILTVLFLSVVEKYAQKISPKPVRVFLVPLICFTIVVPVALLILGPLGFTLGQGLTVVILFVYEKLGWLAVGLLAAILPIMVSMGMHKALLPYAISSISQTGMEMLYMPASLAHNISEGGACFAVALRTKNADTRSTAISAGISAIFGITEPALYGVTLQNRPVLLSVIIGSLVSGLTVGIFGLKAFVAMGPGLAGMAMFVDPANSMNIVWAFVGFGAALVVSFIAAFIFYKDKESTTAIKANNDTIVSPLEGQLIPMAEVKDSVFSTGVLGNGVAIVPTKGELYAPVNGKVSMVFDTKHAIGLVSDNGAEILLHVGLETARLEGKGFEPVVKNGDIVKAGQLLMKFDLAAFKGAGYDVTTPMIITNSNKFKVTPEEPGKVKSGTNVMKLEVVE
ncbi:MAG: beta-glucoside transporter subunit [Lachnospiraceae bacterium]|jgi:PTS system beta-glucosides-specific IIC component|nr:beta-glucoside transporter subunit [Lachnospiraceae bacterium]